jgi:hypothetical protein
LKSFLPIVICPHCSQRVSYQEYDCDVVHECNSGNDALDKDSLVEIRNANWNLNGVSNELAGTVANTGENVDKDNALGDRSSTHYLRAHSEYIRVK